MHKIKKIINIHEQAIPDKYWHKVYEYFSFDVLGRTPYALYLSLLGEDIVLTGLEKDSITGNLQFIGFLKNITIDNSRVLAQPIHNDLSFAKEKYGVDITVTV